MISSDASRPAKNELEYIYEKWCPDGTTASKFIKEKRPELKEILRQALARNLVMESFQLDKGKREFMDLWSIVHGPHDPIELEELKHWSRYNVKGSLYTMWEGVSVGTKRGLRAALMRIFSFQHSIKTLKKEMVVWIEENEESLMEYKQMARLNPDIVEKSSVNPLEIIEVGEFRIEAQKEILNQLDPLVIDMENRMKLEVFDALFKDAVISEAPNWLADIDGANVDIRIRECMSLEVKTPKNTVDDLLEQLREIMSGPVEEIMKQLSDLGFSNTN